MSAGGVSQSHEEINDLMPSTQKSIKCEKLLAIQILKLPGNLKLQWSCIEGRPPPELRQTECNLFRGAMVE